jgi:hypothetical protein
VKLASLPYDALSETYKAKNMVRGVLGVFVGALVWIVGFFTLARLLTLIWPDYALHAHTWMTAGVYDFTPPMSGFNILFWIAAEIGAGWLTVLISRRREAGWVLAALLMAYLSYMHLYFVWDRLPWWYNLLVALPSGPAVLLGARLADRFARPAAMIAA